MIKARGKSIVRNLLEHSGRRLVHSDDIPLADLIAFCNNIQARGFKPKHILDVGANRGSWSKKVRHIFPKSIFTLIEPQVEMRPYLDRFCSETPGASWLNAGAGAVEGELMFTPFPDTVSSSFAFTEEEAKELGVEQRMVPIITLDHVCQDIISAIPDIVKIDVEGFEYEVLKGANSLLGKSEIVLLELNLVGLRVNEKPAHEMIGIMADYGYRIYDFTMFCHRPYDGAVGLLEVVFVLENGFLRSYLGWRDGDNPRPR